MSPERRRQVAALGGRTAQERGTAHVYTSEDAPAYGKQGSDARWKGKRKATR